MYEVTMKISLKNTSKISFNLPWLAIAFILIMIPFSGLNAQDEDYEDPTEVFWGDDEEEDDSYEDDEFYDDDTSDYYEDDEFYDDDTSDYYEDEDFDESDSEFEEEGDLSETELADKANSIGYSLNISGSSPSFVNHDMNSYNNSPQINFRLSVEFPMLMQLMGVRFRFGAELGSFGFENYLPIGGEFSGMTAMGLLAFPAGPGKLKIGAGLVGNTFGVTGESTYGFAIGNTLEIRGGVRYTSAFGVKDNKKNDIGLASWLDGLIMLGFNL
jgi:hypothetical protein